MFPKLWQPPIALSPTETQVVRLVKRAKLFVFLRQYRHLLFSAEFQQELGHLLYADAAVGHPPLPPALLALATIVQAYTGVSDDEVIEATLMDRRWQLILDCVDTEHPPFSKGTLVAFRQRLIATHADRRLVERTLEVAAQTGGFSPKALRAGLDSSPLWGAGRVEDTYNLLGHALRNVVRMIADQQGRELITVAQEAGVGQVVGAQSVKALLDREWDDPEQRAAALPVVLAALVALETWLATEQPFGGDQTEVQDSLQTAHQVQTQDVVESADGTPSLRVGVAKERRISVEDAQMRHGRKSRSRRVDGYKRHVLCDLSSQLVCAVGITPANRPEAEVTPSITADLAHAGLHLIEAYVDRGYLNSSLVRDRPPDLQIFCKAWPVRNGTKLTKSAFTLDWEREQLTCPNGISVPLKVGAVLHFPAATCAACPLRERCTSSKTGRSVSIHPDERFLQELRQRQLTPQGRAQLRQRVGVEHSLAHVGYWQGPRARYRGVRKNLFDLRRSAIVQNLHVLSHLLPAV